MSNAGIRRTNSAPKEYQHSQDCCCLLQPGVWPWVGNVTALQWLARIRVSHTRAAVVNAPRKSCAGQENSAMWRCSFQVNTCVRNFKLVRCGVLSTQHPAYSWPGAGPSTHNSGQLFRSTQFHLTSSMPLLRYPSRSSSFALRRSRRNWLHPGRREACLFLSTQKGPSPAVCSGRQTLRRSLEYCAALQGNMGAPNTSLADLEGPRQARCCLYACPRSRLEQCVNAALFAHVSSK